MVSVTKLISDHMRRKLLPLQDAYLRRDSAALGQLAALRRAGLIVGDDPRVWSIVFDALPEELEGRGSAPSYAERAVQAAFHIYAHHQQSMTEPMHRHGVPFGGAVGMLARARGEGGELHPATVKRFQGAALAQNHDGRVQLLRQLTSMMRAQKSPTIGLDYASLAADLFRLQIPAQAASVRLAWARQLHRLPSTDSTNDNATSKEN